MNILTFLIRVLRSSECISNAMDGTDDDMLWDGSEGAGNVWCECEKDEGTDCEDGDSDTD
jgi:hypothetical protein